MFHCVFFLFVIDILLGKPTDDFSQRGGDLNIESLPSFFKTVINADDFRDKLLKGPGPSITFMFDNRKPKATRRTLRILQSISAKLPQVDYYAADVSQNDLLDVFTALGVPSFPFLTVSNSRMVPVQMNNSDELMIKSQNHVKPTTLEETLRVIISLIETVHITRIRTLQDYTTACKTTESRPLVTLITSSNFISFPFTLASQRFSQDAQFAAVLGATSFKDLRTQSISTALEDQLVEKLKVSPLPALMLTRDGDCMIPEIHSLLHSNYEKLHQLLSQHFPGSTFESDETGFMEQLQRDSLLFKQLERMRTQQTGEHSGEKQNAIVPPVIGPDVEEFQRLCLGEGTGLMSQTEQIRPCLVLFVEDALHNVPTWIHNAAQFLAKKFSLPPRIVVMDGPNHSDLTLMLQTGENGFPSSVLVDAEKGVFYNIVGAFTERVITDFLVRRWKMMSGKPLEDLPTLRDDDQFDETEEL